jgi:hypothetical protein
MAQENNYPDITMKITRRVYGQTEVFPRMPVKSPFQVTCPFRRARRVEVAQKRRFQGMRASIEFHGW